MDRIARVDVNGGESVGNCPLFTMRELEEAVLTMKNKKALGPDGIPAEVYKLVFRQGPEFLLEVFNAWLKRGFFSCLWKEAKLALCLLDTGGKVLEKLIKSRLTEAIRVAGDLFPSQIGFRAGTSTVDDVIEVVDAVHRAEAHSRRSRRIVLFIRLDVRKALNSVLRTHF